MATLRTDGRTLSLRLSPLERLGALRGDLRLPVSEVEDVTVSRDAFRELRGIRAPGLGWPARAALGTWRHRGGYDIVALYRDRPAVIVQLRGAKPNRLLVSVEDADADAVAARLRAALGR